MKKISRGGKSLVPIKSKLPKVQTELLISDIRSFIEQSRYRVSRAVNAELSMLYWKIGQRIRKNVLKEKRASYGKEILSTLSIKLVEEYGAGFSQANLFRMVRFAEVFPDEKIVTTLSAQLGWSHFVQIIALSKGLQREFYAEMCRVERWSVRQLREKVRSMLYERTALSRKPEKLIKQELDALREENKLTPDLVYRPASYWGQSCTKQYAWPVNRLLSVI